MAICGNINIGVEYLCEELNPIGLEQTEICLINRSDIDFATTVITTDAATNVHNVSLLNLVGGAVAYSFEGIPARQIMFAGYTKNDGDFVDTVAHTVNVALYTQCEANLSTLNQFLLGANVVAIVEQKIKGANNDCAFQIYGLDAGLKAGELTYNSNENSGIVLLPLTSRDPAFEKYVPYSYQETDYATTLAKIQTLKTP
jgi:hypothetical protein